jgi:hypothetical protein
MQVERGAFVVIREYPSGERVSIALVTYPKVWDNSSKGLLIPDVVIGFRNRCLKDLFALGGACVPSASW